MNGAARTDRWLECCRNRSQSFSQQRRRATLGSCSRGRSYRWCAGSLRFLSRPRLQFLISRFTIDCVFIMTEQDGGTYDLFSLIRRNRTDLTARWNNFGALYNLRTSIFVQHRHKRFAYRKLGERRLDFQLWILP